MDRPIFDPPVPYLGPLQVKFIPGGIIRVQGFVSSIAYRFNINLQCGPQTTPQDDIALQFSARILDGYIVLNSLQNGIWGEEQRNLTMPIRRAEKFEIIFRCEFSQYKITINGHLCCKFAQRIHYDRISHLAIDGDLSIIQISYESDTFSNETYGYGLNVSKGLLVADAQSFNSALTAPPPPGICAAPLSSGIHALPLSPGIHAAPPTLGFAQLPPYEATLPNNPPYPNITTPYSPTTMPFNVHPSSDVKGTVPLNVYPSSGAYGIVPPPSPPGAPVPLNAANFNFRPVKLNNAQRYCAIFGSILFIIASMAVIVYINT